MKCLIVIIGCLVFCNLQYGQTKRITKSQAFSFFKKEKYSDYKMIYACNRDSLFFKSDTINLYDNPNIFNFGECCEKIEWEFSENKKFIQRRFQNCKEPSFAWLTTRKDIYRLRIRRRRDKIIVEKYHDGFLKNTFEIIKLEELNLGNSGTCRKMTLVKK